MPLLAYKYDLEFQNTDVFTPCADFPDNFLDKFLTMPNNITLLSDGNLYINGEIVLIYDFKAPAQYPVIKLIFFLFFPLFFFFFKYFNERAY